jgi:rubrerythrin
MATTVGTESTFEKIVQNLIILEHDAISAYESTIAKLEDPTSKAKIAEFKADHDSHMAELTRMASSLGIAAPQEGDFKEILTTGKIALAAVIGDKTILKAMATNEIETKMAYGQAAENADAPAEARAFFEKALADETRHKAWMDANSTG